MAPVKLDAKRRRATAFRVPADLEASIQRKVETGRFRDETEVIRVALQLLDAREERAERLRISIAEGFASVERGEGIEWTPELLEELNRGAEEQIGLGLLPKIDVCP